MVASFFLQVERNHPLAVDVEDHRGLLVALHRVHPHPVALDAGDLRAVESPTIGALPVVVAVMVTSAAAGAATRQASTSGSAIERMGDIPPGLCRRPTIRAPNAAVSIEQGSGWRFRPRLAHNGCAPGARDPMSTARTSRVLSMDSHLDLRAAELAREAEARFRLLVEHSSDGLYLIGPDGHVTYASPPVERLLGFDRRELTGRHFLDYLHPDDRDHAGWFFADVLSKPGVALRARYRCLHRDGEFRHLEAVGVNRLADAEVAAVVVNFRDVTERRRAEQALVESEERFRAVFESALVGIARLDPAGRIADVNRAIVEMFGYQLDELRGRIVTEFIHEDERDQASATGASWPKAASSTAAPSAASCAATATRCGSTSPPRWCATRRATRASPSRCSRTSASARRPRPRCRRPTGASPAGSTSSRSGGAESRSSASWATCCAPAAASRRPTASSSRWRGSSSPRNRARSASSAAAAAWSRPWPSGGRSTRPRSSRSTTAGRCAAAGRTPSITASAGLVCKHAGELGGSASICVPLLAQGELLGVLHLKVGAHGRAFDTRFRFVMTVAEHVSLAIANLKLRETLRSQSIRDPLTGLFNRRYMEESLEREMRRAARGRHPVGIIMLDLDDFKGFNDAHGHDAGDTLLRMIGTTLQRSVRAEDIACRYGGEEFALILPEASLLDAVSARRGDPRVGAGAGHRAPAPAGDRHHDLGRRRRVSRARSGWSRGAARRRRRALPGQGRRPRRVFVNRGGLFVPAAEASTA